jgi:putative SOS response-associated peptidase YedK
MLNNNMCFSLSVAAKYQTLESRFNANFQNPEDFSQIYHVSAFSYPKIPIILNDEPKKIQLIDWGLIPHWTKDEKSADEIRKKTVNARAETAQEKPSFRESFKKHHCLILVDGFFEWHTSEDGKKYPFYIHMKDGKPFAIAGLWDEWKNENRILKTFTLLTTSANPLLEKIHNLKKRMPVILSPETENDWLNTKDPKTAQDLLRPYDESKMEAWPISKLITSRTSNSNVPSVLTPFEHKDLKIVF